MHWIRYERGGLIQERENLRSGWEMYLPALGDIWVGRVESYWQGSAIMWRSLDHWYCDFRQGYRGREVAAQELVLYCPGTKELVRRQRERLAACRQTPSALA